MCTRVQACHLAMSPHTYHCLMKNYLIKLMQNIKFCAILVRNLPPGHRQECGYNLKLETTV